MESLGWGIVGIGNIVEGTMAPAMLAEETCNLIACVSREQKRADDFAANFGAPYAYASYDEMLANPEVDAVFIATPNSLHADQVVAAAKAGKHVFCDKPLAIDIEGASRALQACDDARVKVGVNFHNRHLPWIQDVTQIIARGEIGEVKLVRVEVGSGPRHYDTWRANPLLAGLGSTHNVGVHALDFLRVLLASEPVEVMATFDPPPESGLVEMLALVTLRFENGALVYCNINETLAYPTNTIEIYGSSGKIVGTEFTRSRSDGDLTVQNESGESVQHYPAPEAHRLSLADFTKAVLGNSEPAASGLDGLRSAEVCAAIGRSARERRWVDVEYDQ